MRLSCIPISRSSSQTRVSQWTRSRKNSARLSCQSSGMSCRADTRQGRCRRSRDTARRAMIFSGLGRPSFASSVVPGNLTSPRKPGGNTSAVRRPGLLGSRRNRHVPAREMVADGGTGRRRSRVQHYGQQQRQKAMRSRRNANRVDWVMRIPPKLATGGMVCSPGSITSQVNPSSTCEPLILDRNTRNRNMGERKFFGA